MTGIPEYIEQFGSRTFEERPFCEADNLALCQIFYLPLEQVVGEAFEDALPFADAAYAMFAKEGYRHQRLGVVLTKMCSVYMMQMASQPRFQQMKLAGVRSGFSKSPALQYGFGTFLLPDGTAVVVFRGTDDTLTGWKEDFDIYLHKGMACYPYAADYLSEVAAQYDGNIIVCGHSKGGTVALYAALTADPAVRKRIIGVYNNEGPGFHDYSLFATDAYRELLNRYHHLVPPTSMIGMFLAHDYDYTVVENKHHIGPMQHDLSFWKIENGECVTRDDVNQLAKFTDVLLSNLIFRIRDDQLEIVDTIMGRLLTGTNVETVTEAFKKLPLVGVNVLKTWLKTEKPQRDAFRKALHGVTQTVVQTAAHFKRNDLPEPAKNAGVTREKELSVSPAAALQHGTVS